MTVGGPVQSQGLTAFQRKCPASRRKDTFQVEHTPRVPVVFMQEEHCSYLDDVWVLAQSAPKMFLLVPITQKTRAGPHDKEKCPDDSILLERL